MASVIFSENHSAGPAYEIPQPDAASPSLATTKQIIARCLCMALAMLFLLLALAGALLPLLPCTPFLLLGSFFLFRASPNLHQRFLQIRWIGNIVKDWQKSRAVTRATQWQASAAISISLLVSIALIPSTILSLGMMLAGSSVGLAVIWRLPVVRS